MSAGAQYYRRAHENRHIAMGWLKHDGTDNVYSRLLVLFD